MITEPMKRFFFTLVVAFFITTLLVALGLACWLWLETRERSTVEFVTP